MSQLQRTLNLINFGARCAGALESGVIRRSQVEGSGRCGWMAGALLLPQLETGGGVRDMVHTSQVGAQGMLVA